MEITVNHTITIGLVLIAAFNVCVLHFSSELCIQLLRANDPRAVAVQTCGNVGHVPKACSLASSIDEGS